MKYVTFSILIIVGLTVFYPPVLAANNAEILDGDLIQNPNVPGDAKYDVYIVKLIGGKKFRRLILSPAVFLSYGHLKPENVKLVDEKTMNSFVVSDLAQAIGDSRVYQFTPDENQDTGEKRLITTSKTFEDLGYDRDAIFTINDTEKGLYGLAGILGEPLFKPGSFFTKADGQKVQLNEPSVLSGRYLDLNLKDKVVSIVENGQILDVYEIMALGAPGKNPTPKGTFQVLAKEENHFSQMWKVWMPWSVKFTTSGYYIHETPYYPNGSRLTGAYSGGCVRLAAGPAKEIYNWAEPGMPVVLH